LSWLTLALSKCRTTRESRGRRGSRRPGRRARTVSGQASLGSATEVPRRNEAGARGYGKGTAGFSLADRRMQGNRSRGALIGGAQAARARLARSLLRRGEPGTEDVASGAVSAVGAMRAM